MVEIGGIPIFWFSMRYYDCFRHTNFVVALGYKGNYIRRYAMDFAALSPGNLRIDYSRRQVEYDTALGNDSGAWFMDGCTLSLVDTGQQTSTGGRIKQRKQTINNERFFLTWGDGVSTVNLDALLAFHRSHGKLITLTAVRPPAASAISNWMVTRLPSSPRSRRPGRAGSMAPSSPASPVSSTTLRAMPRGSRRSRCRIWPAMVSS